VNETEAASRVGFHAGELAVQRRAGVEAKASRLSRMLAPVELDGGIAAFLADRTFAAITARDGDRRLWISPLTGSPGFLRVVSPTTVEVTAAIPPGDPLHGLGSGQPVGVVVVDFLARRRARINGTLADASDRQLVVEVEQAYGNCPQYIQQRLLVAEPLMAAPAGGVRRGRVLSADDVALIRGADTFFLGTTHPERGNDASHRGGAKGFVRVEGDGLWWPDYPGNNMYNSFGNLASDPEAAVLFADFRTGRTLHLSGSAVIEWDDPAPPGADGHTGRRARFTVGELVAARLLAARQTAHAPYARNPSLTD
jgi:predicted pyridoxine 5'-phosphate oxidase superfamily flavin-nucleotide-binding protein